MALSLSIVPKKSVVVRRGKKIVSAVWFGPWVQRPYVYPFMAPNARETTRLGHPEDPVSHSHHRSIWIAHQKVDGHDFWAENSTSGNIVTRKARILEEEGTSVSAQLSLSWRTHDGKELMREERKFRFDDMPGEELGMDIECRFRAAKPMVTLGKTNFGFLGIRVAKTLRVHEKLGGRVTNSNEGENESGCFGQHADWCDYSGPVPQSFEGPITSKDSLPARWVGVSCFEHPDNSEEGAMWHVRDDGWMGPGFNREQETVLKSDEDLFVRYRIEAHGGNAVQALVGERYRAWRLSLRKKK